MSLSLMLKAQCDKGADTHLASIVQKMGRNGGKVSERIMRKKKLNGNQTQQREWENLEEMYSLCSERQYLY